MGDACENTDRELWRGPDEGSGDFYADSIHVTQTGGIGINCGGMVYVKPLREWHRIAASHDALVTALEAVEFRGHQGKCPMCAGWNMSPNGETPGKHTKDCLIREALAKASA